MDEKLDVVAIGECLIELSANTKMSDAECLYKYYGGDALATAVAALRMGAKVGFITRVGNDSFKDYLLDGWHSEGLDKFVDHAIVFGDNRFNLRKIFVQNDRNLFCSHLFTHTCKTSDVGKKNCYVCFFSTEFDIVDILNNVFHNILRKIFAHCVFDFFFVSAFQNKSVRIAKNHCT